MFSQSVVVSAVRWHPTEAGSNHTNVEDRLVGRSTFYGITRQTVIARMYDTLTVTPLSR
jgi:hypothetical protein